QKKHHKQVKHKKIEIAHESLASHEKHRHGYVASFFSAKSVAIIGASRTPEKIGHVILKNLLDGGFRGFLYPINPNAENVLGIKAHKSVLSIEDPIDLAVIAVQADIAIKVAEECGKKGIKNLIIISSGFAEEGFTERDKKLRAILEKYQIKLCGPNCLGIYDAHTKLDTLFLPRYRLQRPNQGGISFISQSGAVGSAIMDYATERGYGFAKFISYGNAMNTDESDLLEFLGNDEATKVICVYIEDVKDGRKFIKVAKDVGKKKPIIAIKGGRTSKGAAAAQSHTGALAGSAAVYRDIFRQCNVIEADTLEELFEYAKMLDKSKIPSGNKVHIITNGGGYGIIATDSAVEEGLEIASLSKDSLKAIKRMGLKTENPLDLLGDANNEKYKIALQTINNDKNADVMLVIILYQTPLITTDIVNMLTEFNAEAKKPLVVVSTGGELTELLSKRLEELNVPVYTFPKNAVRAISKMVEYYKRRHQRFL
ncbi:MAG: CoA-binding protein, partial [Candidatus Aenigmarchaeota archaeon]|nr:CoA-binding protein [Candidatus Aenigmarchaeota archaeon]